MKKIGEYTTRGSLVTDNAIQKIILFDGKFDTAYRVTEFVIAPHDMDNTATRHITSKLMTDDDVNTGVNWNWENNEEIAWSTFAFDADNIANVNYFSLVDPDNLVVEDLYINADSVGGDIQCNYFIRMEKYDISDSQGALAMVRNRSQA